jgi:hypothetical protein
MFSTLQPLMSGRENEALRRSRVIVLGVEDFSPSREVERKE